MEVLRASLASVGYATRITSTYRSFSEQRALYAAWKAGRSRYPAAAPGTSKHELGLAFDLAGSNEALAVAGYVAPHLGLRWGGTFSTPDVVHFEA